MDENTQLSMWERFVAGFEIDPEPDERALQEPPMPTQSYLYADTYDDFVSLGKGTNSQVYGATGIMAVKAFSTACYASVQPGTMFLFPGTNDQAPPPYDGALSLNCQQQHALLLKDGALHWQLCHMLEQGATVFIGFYLKYPLNPATVGYASGTCNTYWFGTRTLPGPWQAFVLHSLQEQLGGR